MVIQVNDRKIKVYYTVNECKYLVQSTKESQLFVQYAMNLHILNVTKYFVFFMCQLCYSCFLFPFIFFLLFFVILSFVKKLPDGQYLHNKNAAAKMYMANGEKTKHDIEYESTTK